MYLLDLVKERLVSVIPLDLLEEDPKIGLQIATITYAFFT